MKPLMDKAMHMVLQQRPIDIDVYARIGLTFQALEQVAEQLCAFPGHNLVWITDGMPITLAVGARKPGNQLI